MSNLTRNDMVCFGHKRDERQINLRLVEQYQLHVAPGMDGSPNGTGAVRPGRWGMSSIQGLGVERET
jgi:hypothetical protein